jgi:hypothetical protein
MRIEFFDPIWLERVLQALEKSPFATLVLFTIVGFYICAHRRKD